MEINKDVVRRVLARHYRPNRRDSGPSWLTFLGHAQDSLWSLDLFRTESIVLKTHWVLVVMDQFSRRIIGFGVQAVAIDGAALCRMFNQAISARGWPARLSLDHDPLFQSQRWQANLRILGIEVVPTVPQVPWSHPFVERVIRSIREEYLDQLIFYWNASDLEQKLAEYRSYFNERRVHQGLGGKTPAEKAGGPAGPSADLAHYGWQSQCHGLVQLPIAARQVIRHVQVIGRGCSPGQRTWSSFRQGRFGWAARPTRAPTNRFRLLRRVNHSHTSFSQLAQKPVSANTRSWLLTRGRQC